MKRNHLYFLVWQLKQIYSLDSRTQTSSSGLLGTWLQVAWCNVATFMRHQPASKLQSPDRISQSDYRQKMRLYPFLPAIEEERDWLEKTISN